MKPNKCRIMCPSCGRAKMQFGSEKEAKLFIKFNGSEIADKPEELRVYYCDACCCYHISSKPFKKNYEHRTNNLIDAYHKSIYDKDKNKLIKQIKTVIKEQPNIFIKKSGRFHITHFKLDGKIFIGLDDFGVSYELHQCEKDELESMLNKLKIIVLNIIFLFKN